MSRNQVSPNVQAPVLPNATPLAPIPKPPRPTPKPRRPNPRKQLPPIPKPQYNVLNIKSSLISKISGIRYAASAS